MKCIICGQRAEEESRFCDECIEEGWPEELNEILNEHLATCLLSENYPRSGIIEFSDADSGL